jgi:tetratricopeptide (TPR) repeat protein
VLHRDLKPSNLLVVEHDGVAVPKVIDFGIAKLLATDQSTLGSATVELSIKGTPAYMSPEQTRGYGELTVRSDVYTLGVILYELLTGDTPLSLDRTHKLELPDLLTAIREEVPLPPSTFVLKTAKELPSRSTRFTGVSRLLRGDLDVIVLRALQKNPGRRYESAEELAKDIERHLERRPILARRPTLWYRSAKFLQRHRVLAGAGAAVAAALAIAAVVSVRSYFTVREALRGETAARVAAVQSEKIAVARKAEAEAARQAAERNEIAARTARDAAIFARNEAEQLITYMLFDLRKQLEPLGRSRLLAGLSERAEQYFSRQPEATDDDNLERNRLVMYYNRAFVLLAQGDVARAIKAFQSASATAEKRVAKHDDPLRREDLAMASLGLGIGLRAAGRDEEARQLFEQTLAPLRTQGRERRPETLRLLAANLEQLGELRLRAADAESALALFREQEALARGLWERDKGDARTAVGLGIACEKVAEAQQRLDRPGAALPCLQEEVELLQKAAGDQLDNLVLRRSFITALEKLGNILLALKRPAEAQTHFEHRLREAEVLARVDPTRLEFRRDLAVAHGRLAAALIDLGQPAEALPAAEKDLQLSRTLVEDWPSDPMLKEDLASAHSQKALILLTLASNPSSLSEARQELGEARDLLQALAQTGGLSSRARETMYQVEKALSELNITRPR